jgi:hypothetical protein
VIVPVHRTFSTYPTASESSIDDFDYWFNRATAGTESLSWSDLLKKRIVVILGEAGTGKSFEFEHQAARLQRENRAAFLLALNQLTSREHVDLALTEHRPRFTAWLGSDTPGYFFLDAVNESRLN